MKRFFSCRSNDEGVKRNGSCEGKLVPDDLVASGGKKSIGSVGSGFDSVQRGSKLDRILCQI